jgi:hypothetical protein
MVSRRKNSAECAASLSWDPLPHNRRYAELFVSLAWRIPCVCTLEPVYHPHSHSCRYLCAEAIGCRSTEEGASAPQLAGGGVVERSNRGLACEISAWPGLLVSTSDEYLPDSQDNPALQRPKAWAADPSFSSAPSCSDPLTGLMNKIIFLWTGFLKTGHRGIICCSTLRESASH